jgi:hypothetical protein
MCFAQSPPIGFIWVHIAIVQPIKGMKRGNLLKLPIALWLPYDSNSWPTNRLPRGMIKRRKWIWKQSVDLEPCPVSHCPTGDLAGWPWAEISESTSVCWLSLSDTHQTSFIWNFSDWFSYSRETCIILRSRCGAWFLVTVSIGVWIDFQGKVRWWRTSRPGRRGWPLQARTAHRQGCEFCSVWRATGYEKFPYCSNNPPQWLNKFENVIDQNECDTYLHKKWVMHIIWSTSGERDHCQTILQSPKDKTRIFSAYFMLLLMRNIFLNHGRIDPPPMPAMIICEVKQNAIVPPDETDAILFSIVLFGTHHLVDPSKCRISPSLR